MSAFVSRENDSNERQYYSRKEKSLGLLCSNFLKLYNRDGVELIGLDDAATRLGVERRRIYDVVNILESVGVVARKAKNQYSWKGFSAIPRALELLKAEGLRENFHVTGGINTMKVLSENENGRSSSASTDGVDGCSSKSESKREKSLWLLTQNFVKLFLCSDVEMITLDSAALALLGDQNNSIAMRTKVRRLYDIANVFSSMNLIEKTHHPDGRRPAYKWLGWRGKPCTGTTRAFDLNQVPMKRVFGNDITNYVSKKNKMDSLIDLKSGQKENVQANSKSCILESNCDENTMQEQTKQRSNNFVYGPFTPASVRGVGDPGSKNVKWVKNLESLSSMYRPQYQNQALSEVFGHYVEAWKSWNAEAGKERIR